MDGGQSTMMHNHLVPPLPQRRSKAANGRRRPSTFDGGLAARRGRSTSAASGDHRRISGLAGETRRAVDNDYKEVPAIHCCDQTRAFKRPQPQPPSVQTVDVLVEIPPGSGNGAALTLRKIAPAAPVPLIVDANGRSKLADIAAVGRLTTADCEDSILCDRCGKCRCVECVRQSANRRHVGGCCSFDDDDRDACCRHAIDVVSCVYCVRSSLRRCGLEDDDDSDGDSGPHHRSTADGLPARSDDERGDALCDCRSSDRWAFMVALSLFIPCLCLYWPMRCVACLCTHATRSRHRGCRCRPLPSAVILRQPQSHVIGKELLLPASMGKHHSETAKPETMTCATTAATISVPAL